MQKKKSFKIRLTVVSNFQRVFLVMHESVCVYDITLCVYKNVQNCTQTKLYIHKYVRTHSLNLPMQKCKKKKSFKIRLTVVSRGLQTACHMSLYWGGWAISTTTNPPPRMDLHYMYSNLYRFSRKTACTSAISTRGIEGVGATGGSAVDLGSS
jgi:hypothetical protein